MPSDHPDNERHRPAGPAGTGGPQRGRRAARPRRRAGPRARTSTALAALGLVAVAAAAGARAQREQPPEAVSIEQQLRQEIDGMLDAGLPPGHPKVEMVEDQLAAVERGAGRPARGEPGVDVGALLKEAEAAEAAQDAVAAAGADTVPDGGAGWESGPVLCEPVPGLLGADELAGATCLSVPQPDGTSRYVAVGADGVVRSVHFGDDGEVRRLPDTPLPAPPGPGTGLAPTPEGDLRVTPRDAPPQAVDLP